MSDPVASLNPSPCRISNAVALRQLERARMGFQKYGVTCARQDLTFLDWLRHAQEETMDFAVYLERAREDFLELLRLQALFADPQAVCDAILSGEIALTWEQKRRIAAQAAPQLPAHPHG